jgi:hypothetical protein
LERFSGMTNPLVDIEFTPFPKIGRLKRGCVITEKIDGTNAAVRVLVGSRVREGVRGVEVDGHTLFAQSRSRFISPGDDNFGFAAWVWKNAPLLVTLGEGLHFGEWWGAGIQRGYGMSERVFSLFNVGRWREPAALPECCRLVPVLFEGDFSIDAVDAALDALRVHGSAAAPGFNNPEGVVTFHTATRTLFKTTLEKDDAPKGRES